jgi:raffinose/stachyose/melibiose transport system permease protein
MRKGNGMRPSARESRAFTIVARMLLVVFGLASLYPFFWMVTSALKDTRDIFLSPTSLPRRLDLRVFTQTWRMANLGTAFTNSLIVTLVAVAAVVLASSLAAYALARMRFRGQRFILASFVSGQIVSAQIALVPLFALYIRLGWFDSLPSLISACTAFGIPLSVLLFWSFFTDVPKEIEESTKIDGCPSLAFYGLVLVPLSAPIFASVIIFQSLFIWNEYLFALTFLKRAEVRTIPIQMQVFFAQYSTDWAKLFAALTMTVIPIVVIYLSMQRAFIKGLTAGAVKG